MKLTTDVAFPVGFELGGVFLGFFLCQGKRLVGCMITSLSPSVSLTHTDTHTHTHS